MQNVLIIKSSSKASDSVSSKMADYLKGKLASGCIVKELDVGTVVPPVLSSLNLQAMFGAAPSTPEQSAFLDFSKQIVESFEAADTVVIAYGLYNFTVPIGLHALFDALARSGKTFKYTQSGPVGLLKGKKVVLLAASGGVYSEGAAQSYDLALPYLKTMLGFLGMTDVQLVRAEGISMAKDGGQQVLSDAKAQIDNLFA